MARSKLEDMQSTARRRFDDLINELIEESVPYMIEPGADCGMPVEAIFRAMEEIVSSRLDFSSFVLQAYLAREEKMKGDQP